METLQAEPLPMIEQIRQAFDHLDSLEDTLNGMVEGDVDFSVVHQHVFFVRQFFIRELERRERELLVRLKKDESV